MSVVEGASPWRIKGAYSLVDSVGEGRPLYLFIPDLRLNFHETIRVSNFITITAAFCL